MGRQNVPRDQWLAIGVECPHCGERVTEADVYSWRPTPEDPKRLPRWLMRLELPTGVTKPRCDE